MKHPLESTKPLYHFYRNYHRHSIMNLELLDSTIREGRGFILVGNHAFNYVDPGLLLHSIYERYNRVPRVVGQRGIFFRFPVINDLMKSFGMVPHEDFRKIYNLIHRNKPLLIYPGGIDEAMLRDYASDPYKLNWENRPGIIKLVIRYRIPVYFVAGLGVDEIPTQGATSAPDFIVDLIKGLGNFSQERARWFYTALGVTAPAKVTHVLTEPIIFKDDPKHLKSNDFVLEKLQWFQQTCQHRLDRIREELEHIVTDPLHEVTQTLQKTLRNSGF